jgi:hypothetical protein
MANTTIITKAQLAREVNLSRARISQLVARGLPVRTDGRLDRGKALGWVTANRVPERGGWGEGQGRRRRMPACEDTSAPALPLNEATRLAHRQLLDHVVRASEALPEVLLTIGVRDWALIRGAIDVFVELVFHFALPFADGAYDWDADDDRPIVTPNYQALAKRFHLKYDRAAAERQCDELYSKLCGALTAPRGAAGGSDT